MTKLEEITAPQFIASQYQNPANLDARIRLHQQFSTNPYGWQRWIFDKFTFLAHSRILEIGCGPGDLWNDNADR